MSSVGRCQDSSWKVSGLYPVWILVLCSKTTRWDVRLLRAVIHWLSYFSRSFCSRQQVKSCLARGGQLCFKAITVNTHVSVSSYWLVFSTLPCSFSAVTLCLLKFYRLGRASDILSSNTVFVLRLPSVMLTLMDTLWTLVFSSLTFRREAVTVIYLAKVWLSIYKLKCPGVWAANTSVTL